jgi:hypothetical protein
MVDLLELKTAATKILETIENVFNMYGVVLPARKYTTVGAIGSVAYDCEQLTVSWQESYSGLPGNPQIGIIRRECATFHTGVFIVELVRPIPVSLNADIPPEPFLIQEAADALMQDVVLLKEAGEIAAEDSLTQGGTISITAGDPAGGMQSIVMTINMLV